ncbi:hypothetical protein IFM89_026805 [Coptis chinensis]|uniref:Uncharacterized protein n=1 Tax=Coptis chinensis TaxID=261450 RepID=A0A835M6S2_9MAGN|nr:hypothetical protein IFM89_026805 [Coptis chinensis]
MLQLFPLPTPSPSLTPAPTPNYGLVISKDKVREAVMRVLQKDEFIDMFYQELLNAPLFMTTKVSISVFCFCSSAIRRYKARTAEEVEMVVAKIAVILAISSGWKEIRFEEDCSEIIRALSGHTCLWALESLRTLVNNPLLSFNSSSFN